MSTTVIIIIVVAAILLIGFILFFIFKGKKDDDDKPKPEPQPDPEPEPKPDPEPDPEPEPEPEPDPKPKPDPIPIPDPIFEVGDTITNGEITATIVSMNLGGYVLDTTPATFVSFRKQDEWKLVPKVDPEEIKGLLVNALSKFSPVLKVKEGTKVFDYLLKLVEESYYQFYLGESGYELPYMYDPKCFPYVYDYYGEKEETEKVYQTMLGWLISLQLSELCPYLKNQLYKIGYELGGYTMNDYLYGYSFKGDPNVARLVASSIYVTMRGTQEPDIKTYREELGGTAYPGTLQQTYDKYSRNDVKDKDFFTDFRKFMNSAPGPYAPGYKDRSGINPTFPDQKASNGCLQVDMDLYNKIIVNNNLDEQTAVQATADEEADNHHVFGTDKRNVAGKYNFNAVFGETTLGEVLDPDSSLANFFYLVLSVGSSSRGILQHDKSSLGHYEYGRLRPGCSEQREAQRKSYTDDRYNVLACFDIEDNDGAKQTYYDGSVEKPYYDENGNWTNAKIQSKEDYESQSKDLLWANSYPSGHSSGMWCGALALMEIIPEKADLIMRAANSFAVNRTVARYHWNSDTIQGRVLGSATNAICHATSDYDDKVKVSRLDRKLQA